MVIKEKWEDKIIKDILIRRYEGANALRVEFGNLIQYEMNPSREKGMFDIPEDAIDFSCDIIQHGGITRYIIGARNDKGNVLNTFHYLM